MHKIWKLRDSKTNKLVVIKDQAIYKGNINEIDFNRVNAETTDFYFLKDLFNIPYSYIRKVENQTGKNYIKIFFGNGSEEELFVKNESTKNEIFEFIKEDFSNLEFSSELPSVFKYAKAQFFAIFFLIVIFLWSLYLAIQMENGVEYKLYGNRILGIIMILASLGIFKLVSGFLTLLSIAIFSLIKRLKSRSETKILKR